jgi:hypothetical protein
MVMTPIQAHIQVEVALSAGQFPIVTGGEPGVHGEVVTGRHGWGVNTPMAAAVAADTEGFARLLHTPKEAMFTRGL